MNFSSENKMSDLRDRFLRESVGAGGVAVAPKPRIAETIQDIELNLDNVEGKLDARNVGDVETVPRDTVLKMLTESQLDELFTFNVVKGEGLNYVQAMRQVLSRARAKALKKKKKLDEFRMLFRGIVTHEDHDEVRVLRTKQMSEHEESVYDDLLEAFEKK